MSGPALSSVAAALLAERLAARFVVAGEAVSGKNAFDEPLASRVAPLGSATLEGLPARGAAFVSIGALVDGRGAFADLIDRRCAAVVHAVLGEGTRDVLDAHAALDLGAPVLFARDGQDGADLAVVAHRLSEDAEVPVLVLHESACVASPVVVPDAACVRGVLDPAPPPLASAGGRRQVAERAPFALASALRAFERFSGRKADVIRGSGFDAGGIVLVAGGGVARAARAALASVGARELPVGLLEVVSLRPFPGPEIVKALARARVVVVIERVDSPLGPSSLSRAVKAAFVDALTWTPGYPGIGRVPTLFSACIDATPQASDVLQIVDRIQEGELAPRAFVVERS